MTDFLSEVSEHIRQRLSAEKNSATLAKVRERLQSAAPARPFAGALRRNGAIGVIAELKQASPSAGVIRTETNRSSRLESYAKGGAAALSILTEERYFHGSTQFLEAARKESELPLLRKDFLIDAYQIDESRGLGADAILLIMALLSGSQLKDFMDHARGVHLEALVEIHNEAELDQALDLGARLIGINNRDLRSLKVDPTTAKRLAPRIPVSLDCTVVVESGIKTPAELQGIRSWGAHAVLIGEALMRQEDPEAAVKAFVEAGQA